MIKLSYDLHIHSCLSPCASAEMTPANIAAMADLIGLDVIAAADHNSCRNCVPLIHEASKYNISVICAMELCTAEEVHVLCYFPDSESAMDFDSFIYYDALPDIKNRSDYFGKQIIYDNNDCPHGALDRLLISATAIPFEQLSHILKPYGAVMVPAHIDKPCNSLISNLGFIPEGSTFKLAELHDMKNMGAYRKKYPYLKNCRFLNSSDAHQLYQMSEPVNFIEAEENTAPKVFEALKRLGC